MPSPTPHTLNLHAYTPGLQPQESGWVKLNTNENPYPPSPKVREAILRELGEDAASLRLYPEPLSAPLRAKIAQINGLKPSQVFVGNGSDEVLKYLVWAYSDSERKALMLEPSYSLYPVLTAIKDSEMLHIPLEADMALPVDAVLKAQANLIFITQPNAPTGVAFALEAIAKLASRTDALVVVDEAYVAFAEADAVPLLKDFSNVCITRTFSKSHSLAGLRVGYLMGRAEVVDILDRVRDAYNLDRIAQVAALAALEDEAYYAGTIAKIKATRDDLRDALEAMGWHVYPSQANFLFVAPKDAAGESGAAVAKAAYAFLESQKILVRYFPKSPATDSYLRITIGLPEDMDKLLAALKAFGKTA